MHAPLSPVVIRFGRLGDTVLLQPLLHKLHRRYGLPCRLLALGDGARALFGGHPDVSQVTALRSQHGSMWLDPRRLRAAFALRDMREAPFYICENEPRLSTKVKPMLSLAGIDPAQCVFINDTPPHPQEHQIDWLLRLGDRVPERFRQTFADAACEDTRSAHLPCSETERADCLDWLDRRGLRGQPLVLLQPANKRTMRWNGVRPLHDDDKAWPVDRWAALTHAIHAGHPDARLLLCGAPDERGYIEQIRRRANLSVLTSACGELPLPRLKALLEMAHSMVSVDTGPAHLAAAMGCPLVVMFGARSPENWAPRSSGATPVVILGGLPLTDRVDAQTVEQVMQAWQTLGHDADAKPVVPSVVTA